MIQADEIAGLLGYKTPHFRRLVKKLVSEDGMPARLPGGRWHRASLMNWLAAYGPLKAKAGRENLGQIRIAVDREKLTEKYAAANQQWSAA